ncbi:MAG: hypothetical protein HGA44_20590, partial [Cellulomonadaceae bacterium]|nr:hypothetical protein [Cellulomonadaceae bacterium]
MSTEYSADEVVDAQDLAVLADLARILAAADPPPPDLADRALFALTLDGLQAEVMELHVLDVPALAVRGGDVVEARTITFTSEAITALVTLSVGAAGGVRIDGWCAPAARYRVELRRPSGVVAVDSDDDGSFVFADVAPGPASLLLRPLDGDGPAVRTP